MVTLKLLRLLLKAIIAVDWFGGRVKAGIIVSEHERWIKTNVNDKSNKIIIKTNNKRQSCNYIETSQLIFSANPLAGF